MSRGTAGTRSHWLLIAAAGATVWAVAIAVAAGFADSVPTPLSFAADALRTLLWTLCLLAALPAGEAWKGSRRLLSAAAGALAALTLLAQVLHRPSGAHLAMLGMSVVGCLAVEQIFRNSTDEQKQKLKLFLWTVAIIFCYDLFVFSDAVLFGAVDENLWMSRGFFAAVAMPMFVLAAKRQPDWTETLFISRHVVFYSATLTAVGVYLIAMALVAALIREMGGQWGLLVQLGIFAAALGVLAVVLSSARFRTSVRVFISKHFYRHRYEYRDEWLRLIRTLSGSEPDQPMDQRCIKALAAIVESPGGQLWLHKRESASYEPFAAWQAPFPSQEFPPEAALVRFLTDQQWIIDSDEHDRDPERYNHAFSSRSDELPKKSVIVPLFHRRDLLGFVRLIRPEGLRTLNYEDHDLLKTAGRQVAAFLAHDLATEQLGETRQFEAYTKLSAFVMHDLKNLLAQQALLVENAKRHQHRPEFVADMVRTVDHGVQRMRRLLQQLEQRPDASQEQRVEINGIVKRAVAGSSDDGRTQVLFTESRPLWVHAQPERLSSVISHLIVNAQQASPDGGRVEITIREQDGKTIVTVCDYGHGMSEEFIRKRLFKPFDSTKGRSGMGIGAYQAREILRALGGDISVQSRVGEGTMVCVSLPLIHSTPEKRHASRSDS